MIKKQALSAYDPRVVEGTGVAMMATAQGADHTVGNLPRLITNELEIEDIVEQSLAHQTGVAAMDSLGLCVFGGTVTFPNTDFLAEAINSAHGTDLDTGFFERLGQRALANEREFNRAAGFSEDDDEPVPPTDRVVRVHGTTFDRDIAFAQIRTEGLDDLARERVMREAQSMARLGAHPNLVAIHDIGEEGDNPRLVEEYMAGGTVASLLEDGQPDVERSLVVATDVCRALSFMHGQGLIHRDLKPANIFLTEDGTAKVGDFGLAVALDRSRITQQGSLVGTTAYMPPEQALGAMLYEMVTDAPPFQADDPTAVISQHINTPPVAPSRHTEHCPPSLEALILAMLHTSCRI